MKELQLKFSTGKEQIDKSINHLQKLKDVVLEVDNNGGIANNKAQDVTIKKLTNLNNPTMLTFITKMNKKYRLSYNLILFIKYFNFDE